MSLTAVGVGSSANDGTGDTLRAAMQTINANFATLAHAAASWTPVFTASGVSGVAYSVQQGFYVRLATVVFIRMRVTLTSKGSGGSGAVSFTGLPLTSANNIGAALSIVADSVDFSAGYTQLTAAIAPNTASISLTQMGDNIGSAGIAWSAIANASDFTISGFYFV